MTTDYETEKWRPIDGFPNYQVSDHGRIKSAFHGILKTQTATDRWGYSWNLVSMRKDGRGHGRSVHSLVAEAFIGPRQSGLTIDHIDFDATNNHVSNLQYLTQAENNKRTRDAGRYRPIKGKWSGATGTLSNVKLSAQQVFQIRDLLSNRVTPSRISRDFQITHKSVRNIRDGKTWKHLKDPSEVRRIIFDVDGCLADYNNASWLLLRDAGAGMRPFEDSGEPSTWNWFERYGASQEHIATMEERQTKKWWANLRPVKDYDEEATLIMNRLCRQHELTFVTARSNKRARNVTEEWLRRFTFSQTNHVVVVPGGDKTGVFEGIKPHIVVEDNLPTLLKYADLNPSHEPILVLVNRAYNQGPEDRRITRVPSTLAALRLAEQECQ